MQQDPFYLNDTLREVFSLVPTNDSISSCREVIAQYGDGNNSITGSIIWAEFETDMSFLRAGVSHAGTMETWSILSSKDHAVVAEIAEFAKMNGLRAGMLVPATDQDGFHWCIPYTALSKGQIAKGTLRTVLVTRDLFFEIFDLFNRHCQLTPAEKLYVFQLVSGLNPSKAAKLDDVSVETKRSHLKRAMSKLGCASQTEIMRMMISQMIHLMHICEQDSSLTKATEIFTADHLREPLRLSAHRLPNGRLQRVWELGPAEGKPLLVLHGFLFPFLMLNAYEALERLNLRLVIPIRSGYLDDHDSAAAHLDGSLIEQTVEDLRAFIQLTWSGPVEVLCHATGAYFAMLIAEQSPDLFSRMVVTSINLMNEQPSDSSPSKSFLGGIRKLGKHNGMYKILVSQFQKKVFSNERTTKYVLRRLFSDCSTDLDALNGTRGHGQAFDWYRALHEHSPIGIASDFSLVPKKVVQVIQKIDTPMVFLHGPNDCFTSTDEMAAYVALNKNAELHILKEGGHLAIASHSQGFWDAIEKAFE